MNRRFMLMVSMVVLVPFFTGCGVCVGRTEPRPVLPPETIEELKQSFHGYVEELASGSKKGVAWLTAKEQEVRQLVGAETDMSAIARIIGMPGQREVVSGGSRLVTMDRVPWTLRSKDELHVYKFPSPEPILTDFSLSLRGDRMGASLTHQVPTLDVYLKYYDGTLQQMQFRRNMVNH